MSHVTSEAVAELGKILHEVRGEAERGRHYEAMNKLVPVVRSILSELEDKSLDPNGPAEEAPPSPDDPRWASYGCLPAGKWWKRVDGMVLEYELPPNALHSHADCFCKFIPRGAPVQAAGVRMVPVALVTWGTFEKALGEIAAVPCLGSWTKFGEFGIKHGQCYTCFARSELAKIQEDEDKKTGRIPVPNLNYEAVDQSDYCPSVEEKG
jgi:hypothetical protein